MFVFFKFSNIEKNICYGELNIDVEAFSVSTSSITPTKRGSPSMNLANLHYVLLWAYLI